ncbi:AcrR family transcriptional regulator [Actinoplanes octamycinicus]|uniref:AcrR family transcriptional regulator n=1 Tax=Actinoplanes octamycinicus TaxID=135948 RepID=A0A7W7M9Z4_9ACTN|nr:TetR/AcrR family transcriptional regulator [Actinoplanes octamycinicus]MBB4742533.1 AcrR family transcriptional regulator [Actinoplanes octamycinicus]
MVTRRRAETRGRLLDAALQVFAAKGWGQTRIEEVCEAAGYTRGAFYSNFASLDELFFALYDDRADLIAAQVTAALADPDPDFPAVIARVADTLLLDRDWLLIKTDFLLHAARNPEVAGRLAEHRAALRAAIEQRLATMPLELPDVPAAARAVIAAYDGVTVQLLLDGDTDAARTWLTQLLTALLVH